MPLTEKGDKIMGAMKETYPSDKKAKEVFYASKNAGTISGVDADPDEDDEEERKARYRRQHPDPIEQGYYGDSARKDAEPFAGKETPAEEEAEHKALLAQCDARFDAMRDKVHAISRRLDDCNDMEK